MSTVFVAPVRTSSPGARPPRGASASRTAAGGRDATLVAIAQAHVQKHGAGVTSDEVSVAEATAQFRLAGATILCAARLFAPHRRRRHAHDDHGHGSGDAMESIVDEHGADDRGHGEQRVADVSSDDGYSDFSDGGDGNGLAAQVSFDTHMAARASTQGASGIDGSDGYIGPVPGAPPLIDGMVGVTSPAAVIRAIRRSAQWVRLAATRLSHAAFTASRRNASFVDDLPNFIGVHGNTWMVLAMLAVDPDSSALVLAALVSAICEAVLAAAAFLLPWLLSAAVVGLSLSTPGSGGPTSVAADPQLAIADAFAIVAIAAAAAIVSSVVVSLTARSSLRSHLASLHTGAFGVLAGPTTAHGPGSHAAVHAMAGYRRAVHLLERELVTSLPTAVTVAAAARRGAICALLWVCAAVALLVVCPACGTFIVLHGLVLGGAAAPLVHVVARRSRRAVAEARQQHRAADASAGAVARFGLPPRSSEADSRLHHFRVSSGGKLSAAAVQQIPSSPALITRANTAAAAGNTVDTSSQQSSASERIEVIYSDTQRTPPVRPVVVGNAFASSSHAVMAATSPVSAVVGAATARVREATMHAVAHLLHRLCGLVGILVPALWTLAVNDSAPGLSRQESTGLDILFGASWLTDRGVSPDLYVAQQRSHAALVLGLTLVAVYALETALAQAAIVAHHGAPSLCGLHTTLMTIRLGSATTANGGAVASSPVASNSGDGNAAARGARILRGVLFVVALAASVALVAVAGAFTDAGTFGRPFARPFADESVMNPATALVCTIDLSSTPTPANASHPSAFAASTLRGSAPSATLAVATTQRGLLASLPWVIHASSVPRDHLLACLVDAVDALNRTAVDLVQPVLHRESHNVYKIVGEFSTSGAFVTAGRFVANQSVLVNTPLAPGASSTGLDQASQAPGSLVRITARESETLLIASSTSP